MQNDETVVLATQDDLSACLADAWQHSQALEEILELGRVARLLWESGCSTNEIRALMLGTGAVN